MIYMHVFGSSLTCTTQVYRCSFDCADFDVKIAMADIIPGKNRINRFLMANQESVKPKEFAKRIGIIVTNRIPKIKDTIATDLETR
jgi:hypothetical protein